MSLEANNAPIKVMVVDDHIMFRSGLCALIQQQPDMVVAGQAANGEEAVQKAQELLPDVILMDINMPQMDGIEATRQISALDNDIHIVMLTIYGDDEHVFQAVRAGANGYVLKDARAPELIDAIKVVSRGEVIIEPYLASRLLDEFRRLSDSQIKNDMALLSRQEMRILRMVSAGHTNKEIALDLFLAEQTVKNKLSTIYGKLEVSNRVEAAIRAREKGLLT